CDSTIWSTSDDITATLIWTLIVRPIDRDGQSTLYVIHSVYDIHCRCIGICSIYVLPACIGWSPSVVNESIRSHPIILSVTWRKRSVIGVISCPLCSLELMGRGSGAVPVIFGEPLTIRPNTDHETKQKCSGQVPSPDHNVSCVFTIDTWVGNMLPENVNWLQANVLYSPQECCVQHIANNRYFTLHVILVVLYMGSTVRQGEMAKNRTPNTKIQQSLDQ
ncbi:hypothetical protein DERF_012454, partial [Dermatophagoides farinae]